MAKRKSLIRKRGSSRRSSTGSGFLDPDTNIVGEERNFWWDDLQEDTPRHSMIFGVNETDRQLSTGSRLVLSDSSSREWWKNLSPESEQTASPNPRLKRNLSAEIVKKGVIKTSTSESEKEVSIKKRKVQLKMNSRKSTGNAFSTALNDTDVTIPNSRKKRANHSDSHSNREVLQEKLQEDEEDNNLSLTGHVLKSKPSISRRRRGDSTKDQNPFQDVLSQDSALSHSATRKSVALEKESSRHSIHRNINASKDLTDDRSKLVRTLQATPEKGDSSNLLTSNVENAALESNAEEIDQSSDESEKYEKLKSRFMQRARKSIGRNAFADALVDANVSTFDPNRENDVQKSPLMQQASPLSRRAVSRSKTKIDAAHENSPIRKSPRVSQSTTKKQSLNVPSQAKDITEATSSSTLMSDNDEFRRKKSVFLKPKSRIITSSTSSNDKVLAITSSDDEHVSKRFHVSSKHKSKLNSPKTRETSIRKIDDFFKVKRASTRMNKSNECTLQSQIFNEKMEKVKAKLEIIKNREMAAMKIAKESALKAQHAKSVALRQAVKKPPAKPTKAVHKAFLVNGKPYKVPKLPRPKYWATDRLYRFLWRRMEPKYKLATRVKSEKFVQQLAEIVSVIERRKKYENYEVELEALLKEMSRLNIITTRSDFHHFCQDFMPYEFRVKVVPMILPGNKMNIPFDPEKLHVPILGTE
ncbi:PREDICTED: uncharacterized protein LOC105569252 isoform X2 [Vollenhovia emeryi]|uniref:uncharacterized protein LOC105569252 isoform X2 n=1 Tax=Vollenhovia emeryi TaxID=411798 RepID=UPI0005F44D62|nr:PREDICTED: uncharacterized protein LOC105569252 isoform X2 [Vollenhovia emeryi]